VSLLVAGICIVSALTILVTKESHRSDIGGHAKPVHRITALSQHVLRTRAVDSVARHLSVSTDT
jgi:hypothetical protein